MEGAKQQARDSCIVVTFVGHLTNVEPGSLMLTHSQ